MSSTVPLHPLTWPAQSEGPAPSGPIISRAGIDPDIFAGRENKRLTRRVRPTGCGRRFSRGRRTKILGELGDLAVNFSSYDPAALSLPWSSSLREGRLTQPTAVSARPPYLRRSRGCPWRPESADLRVGQGLRPSRNRPDIFADAAETAHPEGSPLRARIARLPRENLGELGDGVNFFSYDPAALLCRGCPFPGGRFHPADGGPARQPYLAIKRLSLAA